MLSRCMLSCRRRRWKRLRRNRRRRRRRKRRRMRSGGDAYDPTGDMGVCEDKYQDQS